MAKSTSKTASARLTAAERRATAVQLREAGLGFEQIAGQLGCSTSRAHQYVTEALQALADQTSEHADSLRQLEVERLDRMTTGIWPKAKRGDLRSIDRMLKIIERRARLLGLDAPAKVAPTTPDGRASYQGMPEDELDRRIAELAEKLGEDA